jgi:murein DD-endopeptidase MepM/ murein hydrolase activator NlpD
LAVLASPASAEDPRTELEKVRRQLSDVSRQIADARQRASSIAKEVSEAEEALTVAIADLGEAELAAEAARTRVDHTQEVLDGIATRIAHTEHALAVTRSDLRATEDRLENEAVALYMETTAGSGLRIFAGVSVEDSTAAIAYSTRLLAADGNLLNGLDLLRREEERQQVELETQRAEVEIELDRLEEERRQLEESLEAARLAQEEAGRRAEDARVLLDRINHEVRAAEQHKQGLEADAARLQTEIAKLASQGGERPGRLAWPVNGPVSSPFGYRVHPIFGLRRLHGGIDIDSDSGTPIAAAESGLVLLAESYGGYGKAVVIDHGGGLTTLYAHQSKLAVSAGDRVERGSVIGYVGCTGFCTGPHLHFEVWEAGNRVDPMRYLRG